LALNIPEQPPLRMRGVSYEDCVSKIRALYGRDYQVIRRNTIDSGGAFGFFKKKEFEVTYVVMPPEARKNTVVPTQMNFEQEKRKILEANKNVSNPQMKLILDEMRSLRREFDEKTSAFCREEHPAIVRIQELLKKNEFTSAYIKNIVDRIRKEYSLEELDDFEKIKKAVVDFIGETIRVADVEYKEGPQVIILVGPTGVGKTTSIAKLAARYTVLRESGGTPRRVRLVTTDSYRIAAKQQLETYGNLMDIPVDLADTIEDMQKLLSLYSKDVDIILIDTTGHSPKDYEGLARMRKILDLRRIPSQVFLTVSASTKVSDLRMIMQQYEIFDYSALVVTKMDETSCIGGVISIMDEKAKPAVYFSVGQRVPRDLEKANPVRMLIELVDFEIDREHIDRKFSAEGA